MTRTCPGCGEELPEKFRICGYCGTALEAPVEAEDVRRTVTVVFCDLQGSTNLGEALDSEALREVLNVYFAEMRGALERHGGTVEKYIGDAVMAVFGIPRLHEDDALRAVRAANEMRVVLARLNERLESTWGVRLTHRIGVNTGEVVSGDATSRQRLVTGDVVNVAARLEQAAPAGRILLGEPTYRLVRDAVAAEAVPPLDLKGKSERIPAYLLHSIAEGEQGVARRVDTPMVGRVAELSVLLEALQRAETDRRCQLVTVYGPAGVGKSRLLAEFVSRSAGRVRVSRSHCLSYGDGITFWPLAEMVREAASITDADSGDVALEKVRELVGASASDVSDRLAAAIGMTDEVFSLEETSWSVCRFFEQLAADGPVIAVVDDIHWAEDTFLDLLTTVAATVAAPVVVVCSSRPDLLEEQPEFGKPDEHVRRLTLAPLANDESALIVSNLVGSGDVAPETTAQIVSAAGGNPLFVEQMLSMLIDEGALVRDEHGTWFLAERHQQTMPATIAALLTARIDKLPDLERVVLQRASVMGMSFFRGGVRELAPAGMADRVDGGIAGLGERELVYDDERDQGELDSFRFAHGLVRDAAYSGMLKRMRADLHERFVDWFERAAPDRSAEYEEIRGYHLEQAFQMRTELSATDTAAQELGNRAAAYLASAGRRALARGDMPAAANLIKRAATLLAHDDPLLPQLGIDAGEALGELGEFVEADGILVRAAEAATRQGDDAKAATASLVALQLKYTSGAASNEELVLAEVERLLPLLSAEGDDADLARAWRLRTLVHATAARAEAAEQSAHQTINHAERAGEVLLARRFCSILAMCALYGPTPVETAVERCEQVLEIARGDRKAEATTLVVLARLEAMRGDFARARELYRRSRAILDEFGWRLQAALTSLVSGPVEVAAGDLSAAEQELRTDIAALEHMGERNYISTSSALLADVLYRQGKLGEADEFSRLSEKTAAPEDVSSQCLWRAARAKVRAREGELVEAEELAREAVRLIQSSDDTNGKANAQLDLSEVLDLSGDPAAAGAARDQALALYRAKGHAVAAAEVAALVDAIRPR